MFHTPALADPRASLEGFEEVPVVSTSGKGQCRTRIRSHGTGPRLEVELNYENLEGNVLQAHIHLGQQDVNGGIVLFLCSNLASPPAGTPFCPGPHGGTVFRTLTAADVLPVTTQGIAAGEFDEVTDAMRKGKAYCNVHTDMSPGGEIRGQFR
jgi:hypothetical protein